MSDQIQGILDGGPFHRRIMHVAPGPDRIAIPYLPEPFESGIILPPYRWWHRLLRRPVPHLPDPPTFRQAIYVKTSEHYLDSLVYRYERPRS